MSFSGKVVLITGGNSGIGRGIVHRFVAEGAQVAIAARDRAKGARVCAEVEQAGGSARFFEVDLAREPDVEKLIASVKDRFSRLDVVVNNAGVGARRSGIEEGDGPGTRWDKMRGSNLDSTYFTAAHAMPLLKETRGAIVNISSTATFHGNWGLYCVAKAAVEGLTRSLAAEGAPYGIRANCVSPGWIETETEGEMPAAATPGGAWDEPPSLLGRMGTPAEIAAAVVFLASSQASFVTGQTLIVDGGLTITDYTSLPLLRRTGKRLFSGSV